MVILIAEFNEIQLTQTQQLIDHFLMIFNISMIFFGFANFVLVQNNGKMILTITRNNN